MSTAVTTTQPPPALAASTVTINDVAIARLTPSKTNPRKHFDGSEFDELVASVKQHGVLVPLLVRATFSKLGAAAQSYEIVAGERRYRAAVKAGRPGVPVRVLDLTDEEALEIQIVENLQRQDVTPLEEANGLKVLLDAILADQAKLVHVLTAGDKGKAPTPPRQAAIESIAKKIGKSTRHVYSRLKLVELEPEVKKALASGEIEASHADEIVRLQPADQKKALDFCRNAPREYSSHTRKRDQAPSVRELKAHLKETAYISLADAPFDTDDAKLLPAAGSCTDCPKRSGNNPLFVGEKKDLCSDAPCFQQKKLALVKINVADITKKNGEAPILISHEYIYAGSKKKKQPGVLYEGEYAIRGYDARHEYRPIVAGSCPHTKMAVYVDAEDESGERGSKEVGEAHYVCTAGGKCSVHNESRGSSSGPSEADRRRKALIQKEYRGLVLAQIVASSKPTTREDRNLVACEYLAHVRNDVVGRMLELLGWDKKLGERWHGGSARATKIASLTDAELDRAMLVFALAPELAVSTYSTDSKPADLLAAAARYKVDAAKILAEVKERRTKKPKAAKKAAVQTSAKKKTKKGVCSKCGCTPQHRCVVKGKKTCKLGADGVCTGPDCVRKPRKAAAKKAGRK